MNGESIQRILPFAFPLFFVGLWFLATTILGFTSGWFNLQQWYPDDGSEEPLLVLKRQSGVMGRNVRLNNVLTLAAYRSGLSLRMMRAFAPFQKPLLIPWTEIKAEPFKSFFMPMIKLSLGDDGQLKIPARSWAKLVAAAGPAAGFEMPPIEDTSAATELRVLFVQWLILTTAGAAFLIFASRAAGAAGAIPLWLCLALPAGMIAFVQLLRMAREDR